MKSVMIYILLFISLSKLSLAQTDESIYYSLKYKDTSSVIFNNYITGLHYDELQHQLYVSMTSFNNFFDSDPRPRTYSQLLIIHPDNGDIIHSYTDTFPNKYIYQYNNAIRIDSFIYWSGTVTYDSVMTCNKSSSVLLKTDLNLTPLWRTTFDYPYRSSLQGQVHKIDDAGNILYSFDIQNYIEDTCHTSNGGFPGAFTAFAKLHDNGEVYHDTLYEIERDYYIHNSRSKLCPIDNSRFWSAGRYRDGSYLDFYIQRMDTNLHFEEPIMLNWLDLDAYLLDVQKNQSSDEEAYYVSGFLFNSSEHTYAKGLTLKIDPEGDPQWLYVQEGDNVNTEIIKSAITPDNDIILLGYGSLDKENDPSDNGIVYKINDDGDLLWMRDIKETTNPYIHEYLYDFVLLPNGDMIASGFTTDYDSLIMGYRQYGWLVRIDKHGCQEPGCESLSNTPTNKIPQVKIYPNPSENGIFYLTLDNSPWSEIGVEVYNNLGQRVYEKTESPQAHELEINLSTLNKGIYYIVIKSSLGRSIKKIIIT